MELGYIFGYVYIWHVRNTGEIVVSEFSVLVLIGCLVCSCASYDFRATFSLFCVCYGTVRIL